MFYECDREMIEMEFEKFGSGRKEINFPETENAMKGVQEIQLMVGEETVGKGNKSILERARTTALEVDERLQPGWRVMTRVEFINFGIAECQISPDDLWLLASVLDWGRKGEVTERDYRRLIEGDYDPIELLELSRPSIYTLADIALPLRTRLAGAEVLMRHNIPPNWRIEYGQIDYRNITGMELL